MTSLGKFKFMVEDRDLAYVFENPAEAPSDTIEYEIFLDGVIRENMYDEDKALWLMKENPNTFRIVPQGTFDYANADYDETGFPIPIPVQYNAEEYVELHGYSL